MAILKIVLNQEEKGEFFVNVTDEGDFLIRTEDMKKMGFSEVKGKISVVEGDEFISLRSMEGVKTVFDEKKLVLELTADPHLLGKKIFELRYPRQTKVYYPKDLGGFLNYNLTYFARDSFTYDRTALTNQLGFRVGDLLFLSDSSYTQRKGEGAQFVRLMSNITYDRREDLKRIAVGDFFASSGELGSTMNMGGISFSKSYNIDPYFIKYPEISFSGLASLPSEVEVYRDGVLIRKERISPGGFELRDIPTYVGSGLVEVVLKDPFGREQRIRLPYYFSDTLLKKDLHEYSYNIGFSREDFGAVSNRYKDFSFLGLHRYGINDSLTAGIRAEASKRIFNFGCSSTYLIPWRLGLLNTSMAWSNLSGGKNGLGGSLSYLYQGRHHSLNFLLRGFTKDYSNISIKAAPERTKYEFSTGAGYTSALLGSFSLGFAATKKYIGSDTKSLLASYSRKITDRSSLIANFKRDMENRISEFNISINYYFKYGIAASSSYQRTDGISSERIQILKNLPLGEGFGGRASFEANQAESKNFNNYNLQLQYNAKYGQYGGEFISADRAETYSLTAAGGITFVKDSLNFSRPIQDSFALVKVGDLKDVRVYLSNQEIGRTGNSGKILIPNLGSYYENQISINDKDIPIEYKISEVLKYVSPPLRSGSYIEFGATKIQGFIGMLKVRVGEEIKPLEYVEFKLLVEGKELLSPTGKGGEFYLENIKPGKFRGEFKYLDKRYFFDIVIPKSEDVLVDLGEIICE
ncbi:MAG: fimbria/pilus outer membrane usher protein [Thermodesulfobacteriota bacterium]